jgi:hypothetical protein
MPQKLSTTINKILQVPNSVNSLIIQEFHSYMQSGGSSERNQNNNLKAIIAFGKFIGPDTSFYDIHSREQILRYLDTKIKNSDEDPEEKWITTWNDYLNRIKLFFRWLTNKHIINKSDWKTPDFLQIRERRSKRTSPYSENNIWDRDELLTIIKYEPEIRDKAILALLWDLDARNHEITNLKIGNIRLRERYAEGEIPRESTGNTPEGVKERVCFTLSIYAVNRKYGAVCACNSAECRRFTGGCSEAGADGGGDSYKSRLDGERWEEERIGVMRGR